MGWLVIVAVLLSGVSTEQSQQNKIAPQRARSFSQQDQDAIREVVFRYQFRYNSSIHGNKAAVYCLSIEKGVDSPNAFLKRFAGHTPPVRKVSACTADPDKGVFEEGTGKRGLLFRVSSIKRISQAEAEVVGGYFEDGLSASGNTYTVTKIRGAWRVSKARTKWLA